MNAIKRFAVLAFTAIIVAALTVCSACSQNTQIASSSANSSSAASIEKPSSNSIDKDGSYTSKEDVALYIHTYQTLPGNFITKKEAKAAGWVSSKGNLAEVCPNMSIGGDRFYNDDGKLPDAKGRTWKECDIAYGGGFRGSERIVFSSDGLIFYTADHYSSFEQLF